MLIATSLTLHLGPREGLGPRGPRKACCWSLQLWSRPGLGQTHSLEDGAPRAGATLEVNPGGNARAHALPQPSTRGAQLSRAERLQDRPAAARHLHSQSQMGAQDKNSHQMTRGLAPHCLRQAACSSCS